MSKHMKNKNRLKIVSLFILLVFCFVEISHGKMLRYGSQLVSHQPTGLVDVNKRARQEFLLQKFEGLFGVTFKKKNLFFKLFPFSENKSDSNWANRLGSLFFLFLRDEYLRDRYQDLTFRDFIALSRILESRKGEEDYFLRDEIEEHYTPEYLEGRGSNRSANRLIAFLLLETGDVNRTFRILKPYLDRYFLRKIDQFDQSRTQRMKRMVPDAVLYFVYQLRKFIELHPSFPRFLRRFILNLPFKKKNHSKIDPGYAQQLGLKIQDFIPEGENAFHKIRQRLWGLSRDQTERKKISFNRNPYRRWGDRLLNFIILREIREQALFFDQEFVTSEDVSVFIENEFLAKLFWRMMGIKTDEWTDNFNYEGDIFESLIAIVFELNGGLQGDGIQAARKFILAMFKQYGSQEMISLAERSHTMDTHRKTDSQNLKELRIVNDLISRSEAIIETSEHFDPQIAQDLESVKVTRRLPKDRDSLRRLLFGLITTKQLMPFARKSRKAVSGRFERVAFTNLVDGVTLRGEWYPSKNKRRAPVIVLVPAWGTRASQYRHYVSTIYQRHANVNVLLLNLQGHGMSDGDFTTIGVRDSHHLEGVLEWLLVNPNVIGKPIVHGISLGAVTAAALLERRPDLMSAFIRQSGPTMRLNSMNRWFSHRLEYYRDFFEEAGLPPGFDFSEWSKELLDRVEDFLIRKSEWITQEEREALFDQKFERDLSQYPIPTLVISGEDDEVVPLEERIHGKEIVTLPGGHLTVLKTNGTDNERRRYRKYTQEISSFIGGVLLGTGLVNFWEEPHEMQFSWLNRKMILESA